MQLVFSPQAKERLAEYVGNIYESPRYFNLMVKKADTYMPFIEEAFRDEGVPEDLKYLAIQESGLRADAVSTSNAVGFWQMKESTAREAGLEVNEDIDERMHIYRASRAAARYLSQGNKDFDNWVYGIIAYYEGLTGAVPHTEPQYYAVDRMMVDETLHWYAMKAIAHKIAYAEALDMGVKPELWLEPFSTNGESNLRKLYQAHDLEEAEFLTYNKWILNPKRLPRTGNYTYYIARNRETYAGHQEDPLKAYPTEMLSEGTVTLPSGRPQGPPDPEQPQPSYPVQRPPSGSPRPASSPRQTPPPPRPMPGDQDALATLPFAKARPMDDLSKEEAAVFDLQYDLDYGTQYIQYDSSLKLAHVAIRYGLSSQDLKLWNGLGPYEEPRHGAIIYLVKPRKAKYHVVMPGESLPQIAAMHQRTLAQVKQKNRMEEWNFDIYVGQKLYLRKTKPRDEKLIILDGLMMQLMQQAEATPADAKAREAESQPQAELATLETPPPVEAEILDTSQPSQVEDSAPGWEAPPTPPGTEAAGDPSSAPSGANPSPRETRWVTHVVQSGETLWNISQKYQTKVEIIKRINKLADDGIHEGQVLQILARDK